MAERLSRLRWILVAVFVLGGAWPVRAEEAGAEDEATIMEQEDQAEAALPIDKKPPDALSGSLQLNNELSEGDDIVGFFSVKGHAYQLRVSQRGLLPQLLRYNGKTVCLVGKVRVQGKYFIAEGIRVPTPGVPRTDRDKRSGM
jgi:hypothetical protein